MYLVSLCVKFVSEVSPPISPGRTAIGRKVLSSISLFTSILVVEFEYTVQPRFDDQSTKCGQTMENVLQSGFA